MPEENKLLFVTRVDLFNRMGNGIYGLSVVRALAKHYSVRVLLLQKRVPFLFYAAPELADEAFEMEIAGMRPCGGNRWIAKGFDWRLWFKFLLRPIYQLLPRKLREKRGARIRQGLQRSNVGVAGTEELAFFTEVREDFSPEIVAVYYVYLATLLENLPPEIMRMIVLSDVLHVRARSLAAIGETPAWAVDWTEQREVALWRQAQLLVAIQQEEAALVEVSCPDSLVTTFPVPAEIVETPPASESKPTVLFVGSLSEHNRTGLAWFVQEVWPLVRAEVPDAGFQVVGSVGETLLETPPGVELLGRVDSLKQAYSAAAVVVVPLLAGSGLKIKLIEALGHGRPVVATQVGAEGVAALLDGAVAIEDTPEAFAEACVRLLKGADLRASCGKKAQEIARAHFALPALRQTLIEAISACSRGDSLAS